MGRTSRWSGVLKVTTGFSVSCIELRFLQSNMLAAGALLLVLGALSVHGEDPTLDSLNVDHGNSTDETNDWLIDLLDESSTCDPNPCFHGGSCEPSSDTGFKCTCDGPYIGKRCQRLRNVCKTVDCGSGDCVVNFQQSTFFECKCEPPFYGPNCKSLPASVCDPSPCQNGGSCIEKEQSFQCACPEGYTGKFCESAPTDCYEGNGETYRGVTSVTRRGQECLNWNSYFIMSHGEDQFTYLSNTTGLEYNNYCRNPDRDKKPWCYIRSEDRLLWDYCNITKCSGDPAPAPTPDTPDPESVPFSECGIAEPTGRILLGSKSVYGEIPWQASVQIKPTEYFPNSFVHICGGILIDSCWVLTAGHCILEDKEYQVMLGGLNVKEEEEIEQIIPVIETIRHEDYRTLSGATYNDLALLKLKVMNGSYCAKETRFVKKACLPQHTYTPGKKCVISGWGKKSEERGSSSDQLLKAEVHLISEERCRAHSDYGNRVNDSMICAGSLKGGVDSCQGDSGGPLVCEENEKHYVTGVVSWGWGCGRRSRPGVYTNVYKFIDWIKDKIN